jgi:twinkle protein
VSDRMPKMAGHRPKSYKNPNVAGVRPRVEGSEVDTYLRGRGLAPETIERFKIAQRWHPKVGNIIVFPFEREGRTRFVKYLGVERPGGERRLWTSGGDTMPILFGWQAIDPLARRCIITEGEVNAMSWAQMTGLPSFSTPYGAGVGNKHTEWLENEYNHLDRFEVIYLAFDDDEPGRAASADLASRLGRHRCLVVRHLEPEFGKDANDYLTTGVEPERIQWLLETAETADPSELKSAAMYVDAIISNLFPVDLAQRGFVLPFEGAVSPDGRRRVECRNGHVSIWTGYSGHAKTTLLSQVMVEAGNQGHRCCVASMENTPAELLTIGARQLTGRDLESSGREEAIPLINRCGDWFNGRWWVFDLSDHKTQIAKQDVLFQTFEYAHKRYGISQFVIDSLLCLDIDEDDWSGQKKLINRACDFARATSTHVHIVAHQKKDAGTEFTPPTKEGVRGAMALTDRVSNIFGVWRNKDKERKIRQVEHSDAPNKQQQLIPLLALEDTQLVVLKNRLNGFEPVVYLHFDPDSLQFREDVYALPNVVVGDAMAREEVVHEYDLPF